MLKVCVRRMFAAAGRGPAGFKIKIPRFTGQLACAQALFVFAAGCATTKPLVISNEAKPFVAHSGGIVGSRSYTNSKEAFEGSWRNCGKLIETDISWTSDSELVLLHDFQAGFSDVFTDAPRVYSLAEYRKLKMVDGLTQWTLADLVEWTSSHPGVFIITDVKRNNFAALKDIADKYPEFRTRLIPQIYKTGEYWPVRDLGYDNIIFTLYATDESDKEIFEFARKAKLFAVTMPKARALKSDLAEKLAKSGVYVYAHTVNEAGEFETLKAHGVDGIYSDRLFPGCPAGL
ncbi:MAG: hypothetical protein PHV36_14945 [Elusimicrobiales bacterium]|nr:hypothetical protein [Elusimicrobiales bacterium]